MTDDLTGEGTILIGDADVGTVSYWLTMTDETGSMVAEGCISAPEDFLKKLDVAEQVKLALNVGPTFSVVTDGGTIGTRWARLFPRS